jgi:hypothetical protein
MAGHHIGHGIFVSTNGIDFQLLANTSPSEDFTEAETWSYVNDLATPEGKIYAATQTGLKFSADDGATWTEATTAAGVIEGTCYSVAVSGNNFIFTQIGDSAYISDGNGTDFHAISGSADSLLPAGEARIEFAVAPSNASKIYALVIDDDGYLEGVYRSEDDGAEWQLIGAGGTDQLQPFISTGDEGTGLDAAFIAVNPEDEDMVFIGGTYVYRGVAPDDGGYYAWLRYFTSSNFDVFSLGATQMGFVNGDFYYISGLQGLISYNAVTTEYKTYKNYLNVATINGVSLGLDDKILAADQTNGVLYFSREGNTELNATTIDAGTAKRAERSVLSKNNIILAFEATTGQHEGFRRSQDMGEAFAQNFIKDSIGIVNTTTAYELNYVPYVLWESFNNPFSEDSVWFHATKNYSAGETINVRSNTVGYPFEYTLEADLAADDSLQVKDVVAARMFIAAEDPIYKAEIWMTPEVYEYGVEPVWYKIAKFERSTVPSALAVSADANYVFMGTNDGQIWRLSNVAYANDSASAMEYSAACVVAKDQIGTFEDRFVTSVSVDPNDANHVLVTLGNYGNSEYVYESTNALSDTPEFVDVTFNLPHAPVYSSLIEYYDGNRVMIGGEFGLFTLENDSWTRESGDMGMVPVVDIRQQILDSDDITVVNAILGNDTSYITYEGIRNNGVIYVATHGRGVWKSLNYVGFEDFLTNGNNSSSLNVYPNPANEYTTISLPESNQETVEVALFDLSGKIVFQRLLNPTLNHEISIDTRYLPEGTYLVKVVIGSAVSKGKLMIVR